VSAPIIGPRSAPRKFDSADIRVAGSGVAGRAARQARRPPPWAVCVLAALFAMGCGERSEGTSVPPEGWPVGSPVDAVLAYLAVSPQVDDISPVLERLLGWRPAGLANDRMAVLVLLDESMLSGLLGLALPVADAAAFRISLDESSAVSFIEEDRFVLTLSPESELLTAVRAGRALLSGGSVIERIAALRQPVSTTSTWDLSFHEGHALVAPSFEAAFVMRKLLEQMPLGVDAGSPSHVGCLDVERFELAYFEEVAKSRRQLKALLSADNEGGAAGLLGQMLKDRDADSKSLPFDGPTILALLEMLAVETLGAWQLQLFDMSVLGKPVETHESSLARTTPTRLLSRLRWKEPTALSDVLAALRPVSGQPLAGSHGVLTADADRFAATFAEWLRPLVEVVHGGGASANTALAELTELLSPWGGHLVIRFDDDQAVGVVTLKSGERFDGVALVDWFRPLVAALVGDDDESDLDIPVSTWLVDDLLVISSGDEDLLTSGRARDDARAVRDGSAPEIGPCLRLVIDEGEFSLEVSDGLLEIMLVRTPTDEEQH